MTPTPTIPRPIVRFLCRRLGVELEHYPGRVDRLWWLFRDIEQLYEDPPPLPGSPDGLICELPPAVLATRARRQLDQLGIVTIRELLAMPIDQLAELPQIGPEVLGQVDALRERVSEETTA